MPSGGKREGAGRPAGRPNKATADVKAAAEKFSRSAIAVLASIMRDKDQPASARALAANSILDRAHGKPKQGHEHTGANGGPIQNVDLTGISTEDLDRLESVLGISLGGGEGGEDEAED